MGTLTPYGFPYLDGTNHTEWRVHVKALLASKGLHDALTNAEHPDTMKALGLITLCLKDQNLLLIQDARRRGPRPGALGRGRLDRRLPAQRLAVRGQGQDPL